MSWFPILTLLQSEGVDALRHIAHAQTIIAIANGIVGLVFLGLGIGLFIAFRKLLAITDQLQRSIAPLVEKVQPAADAVATISRDATEISANVREKVDHILATADEANHRLRGALDTTEKRLRELGAVLDVVQEETEGLLLDAAAAARGVQTTAEQLRQGGGGR